MTDRLYDISPPITADLAVWPGDEQLTREIVTDIAAGDSTTLSTLRATAHLGAHADAPSHYGADGPAIDACPLERYIGRCRVVRVVAGKRERLGPDRIAGPIDAERVLFATGTYPDPLTFKEDFAGLEPALIDKLADAGVTLVGIDTPSVDPFPAEDLPAHRACLRRGILIVEGLALADVPEGVYELIALPLRLVGFDGSPVRAVLRSVPAGS